MIQQFDVCRLRAARADSLVVVLQSHLLTAVTDTVIVAPLLEITPVADNGYVLDVLVEEERRQVVLSQLAAVPQKSLGRPVSTLSAYEDELRRGLDRIFTGF